HAGVKAIPALEFAYYHTVGDRKYRAVASGQIAIEVKPRATVRMDPPAALRARMHPAVTGTDLLCDQGPSTLVVLLAFAVPPLLGAAGALAWQRLFPDAAARARLRRSRAFRQALKQLQRLGQPAPPEAVAEVVVNYLRSRIEISTAEPTPLEIKQALLAA